MKDSSVFTKKVLSVYGKLADMSNLLDKRINEFALGCWALIDTPVVLNKIIDLSEKKVFFINIKILVEETLKEMDANQAKMLIEKYWKKRTLQDISGDFKISLRTVFRKLKTAEEIFENKFLNKCCPQYICFLDNELMIDKKEGSKEENNIESQIYF